MPTHPHTPATSPPARPLPRPSAGSRWRWDTSRRALVGGGTLAVSLALGLGGAAAGAATASAPPPSGHHGTPPSGSAPPTTAGKVTALGSDALVLRTPGGTTQVVTYTSTTTFRTRTGGSSAGALEVGDTVAVEGTRTGAGRVAATSVMVGPGPPGQRGGRGARAGGQGGPPTSRGAPG